MLKKTATLVLLAATAACGTTGVQPSLPADTTAIPPLAEDSGPLDVDVVGNRIVDGDGRPLVLRGVNFSGGEFACTKDWHKGQDWAVFGNAVLDLGILAEWKVNVVRLPLNEHCWLGRNGATFTADTYRRMVTRKVDDLLAADIRVILDLHWSGAGTTLATGQDRLPNADHSVDFWTDVAHRFKDRPGVLLNLHNEPFNVTWEQWRDGFDEYVGMADLVDAVRSTGAQNPVVVGGLSYANDLSRYLEFVPDDPQLIADVHLYDFATPCGPDTDCWETNYLPVLEVLPLMIGEVGDRNTPPTPFMGDVLAFAVTHDLSVLGWTWNAWGQDENNLILDYDGTPTSGMGQAFRDWLSMYAGTASSAPRGP